MVSEYFNYHSRRAYSARLARHLSGYAATILSIAGIILLVAGLGLLVMQQPFGWLSIAMSIPCVMTVEWLRVGLHVLQPDTHSKTLDGVLDPEILGQLSDRPTFDELLTATMQSRGGYFMAARFGIGLSLLSDLAKNSGIELASLYEDARKIQEQTGSPYITAPILIIASIVRHPYHENILAHLQLSLDDIERGIWWNDYIADIIMRANELVLTGGVGRDWSFGYIPLLTRFGSNISRSAGKDYTQDIANTAELRERIIMQLSQSSSVVLVGQSGVGKSSLLQSVAARLMYPDKSIPQSMQYRQLFSIDSSALIAYSSDRSELEGLMLTIIEEAYHAKNIILCFEGAERFLSDTPGSVDLTSVLLPIIKSGSTPVICTVDEQRLLMISRTNPDIGASLGTLRLEEADFDETMHVLMDSVISIEYRKNVLIMYQALKSAYDLSKRYVREKSMPGKAVDLLRASADYADNGLVTTLSVERAVEVLFGTKVGVARKIDERETLMNLEQRIHERMVGQEHAVQIISDAVRRSRSGIRNQNRPIGTFLFLGPTGVGKTELAKALADAYFGGEKSIVRLDMNEYSGADGATRLIATADKDAYGLSAQITKRPFSVVLLDEFEKAHPSVINAFLQVFDEGILRDEQNREVSFRDAIIIATTNAGAERVQEFVSRGMDLEIHEPQLIDELISSGAFKPELINRFDEIVLFRPLEKRDLDGVLSHILDEINHNLDAQKITVELDDSARSYLIDHGYDPKFGARPMRRFVQKAVENLVAKRLLSGEVAVGSHISLTQEDLEIHNKEGLL